MKKIYVVGMGPGDKQNMTLEAIEILKTVDKICPYTIFSRIIEDIFPNKIILDTSNMKEKSRCEMAIECANNGEKIAIVSSGDASIYAMSSLIYEIIEEKGYNDIQIISISGITSAISGGNILGSPLTGDFIVISLSDMLTPIDSIKKRLEFAGICDLVTVIYNPYSENRAINLKDACDILLKYKSSNTICGYVNNISRDNQSSKILTLNELSHEKVDMFTTIFIGSSGTKIINNKMVTKRGFDIL